MVNLFILYLWCPLFVKSKYFMPITQNSTLKSSNKIFVSKAQHVKKGQKIWPSVLLFCPTDCCTIKKALFVFVPSKTPIFNDQTLEHLPGSTYI